MNHMEEYAALIDPASLYCNEHKKLKKYYLRDKDDFMCEYDGYEYSKSYCHFKDILTEYREEVIRLKQADVTQPDNNSQITSQKLKSSIEKVSLATTHFANFLSEFQEGYMQKLEKFTLINTELMKIKDILSSIDFRGDGTVNFINIGANEAKELKILTLANILIRRRKNSHMIDGNLTEAFISIVRQFQSLLIGMARSSRSWISFAIEDIFNELINIGDEKFKFDNLNKEEFSRQIFFIDEIEELKNYYRSQIDERDVIIENLKNEIHNYSHTINERNTTITQLNITIQEKINYISDLNLKMNSLNLNLEEQIKKYNIIFNDFQGLNEKYNTLYINYEKLNAEFKNSKENYEKTIRSHILQIEEITNIKKRLEIELIEERNKYKTLMSQFESLKNDYSTLNENYNRLTIEFNNNKAEWNILKIKFEEQINALENERKNLLLVIEQLEKRINDLNIRIEQITTQFDVWMKEEKKKYNILLEKYNLICAELDQLKDEKDNLVSSSNNEKDEWIDRFKRLEEMLEGSNKINDELTRKIIDLEKIITDLQKSLEIKINENNSLQRTIIELNERISILNLDIKGLNDERNRLLSEIEQQKNMINNLQNEYNLKIEQLHITILHKETNGNELKIEIDNLKLKIESLLHDLSHKNDEIARLQSELEEQGRLFINMQNEYNIKIEQLHMTIHQKENNRNELNIQITNLNLRIEGLLLELKHKDAEIEKLRNELEEQRILYQKMLGELNVKIEQLNINIINKESKGNELSIEINNLNIRIEGILNELKNKSQEILKLQGELDEKRRLFINMQNEYNLKIEQFQIKIQEKENQIIELNLQICNLNSRIEALLHEISELKHQNSDLTNERDTLCESEGKLCEENDALEDELEALKKNHSELVLELKAQLKQIEILNTKIEELEFQIKSESTKSEEITVIQRSTTSQFSNQYATVVGSKEKLEADLIEKKNLIVHLNSEIDNLHAKYQASLNEINALNEKLKNISVLETNLKILTKKLDEVNALNKSLESQLSNKDTLILQMRQENDLMKAKNEELSIVVVKHKESIANIKNYEDKINALELNKQEIERLKKKIENAEEINQSTRSGRRKSSRRSIHKTHICGHEHESTILSPGRSLIDNLMCNVQRVEFSESNAFSTDFHSLKKNEIFSCESLVESQPTQLEMLINEENLKLISKWLSGSINSSQIKLNLLFKATFDGFTAFDFKKKCIGFKNTLVIAKTNFGKIIGGFTPLEWREPGEEGFSYEEDQAGSSFLFSVNLHEKYNLSWKNYAICNTSNLGPVFGGGSDFEIVDNCNVKFNTFYEIGHSYDYTRQKEEFYGGLQYLIEDYEVYEVQRE